MQQIKAVVKKVMQRTASNAKMFSLHSDSYQHSRICLWGQTNVHEEEDEYNVCTTLFNVWWPAWPWWSQRYICWLIASRPEDGEPISYKSSHGCFDLMAPMARKFCCQRQHDLTTLVPCCPNLLGHTHLLIIPSDTSTIFSSEDSHPALLTPLLVGQESDLASSTLGF